MFIDRDKPGTVYGEGINYCYYVRGRVCVAIADNLHTVRTCVSKAPVRMQFPYRECPGRTVFILDEIARVKLDAQLDPRNRYKHKRPDIVQVFELEGHILRVSDDCTNMFFFSMKDMTDWIDERIEAISFDREQFNNADEGNTDFTVKVWSMTRAAAELLKADLACDNMQKIDVYLEFQTTE
jgi:hypothetical protein